MSPSKVSTVAWDQFYNVINGQNRTGKEKYQGTNPSTGEKLWGVPVATQQDVDEAVKVAKVAFESYRETTVEQRKEYLRKLKDQVSAHIEELTELLCHETGKPVSHANLILSAELTNRFRKQPLKLRLLASQSGLTPTLLSTSPRKEMKTMRRLS